MNSSKCSLLKAVEKNRKGLILVFKEPSVKKADLKFCFRNVGAKAHLGLAPDVIVSWWHHN